MRHQLGANLGRDADHLRAIDLVDVDHLASRTLEVGTASSETSDSRSMIGRTSPMKSRPWSAICASARNRRLSRYPEVPGIFSAQPRWMRAFRRRWAVVLLTPARSAISRALAGAVARRI